MATLDDVTEAVRSVVGDRKFVLGAYQTDESPSLPYANVMPAEDYLTRASDHTWMRRTSVDVMLCTRWWEPEAEGELIRALDARGVVIRETQSTDYADEGLHTYEVFTEPIDL